MTPRVLFVSKPIVPPYHDGTKCLVRDVATHVTRVAPVVMSAPGVEPLERVDGAEVEMVAAYRGAGSFAPALTDNLRAATWLAARGALDAVTVYVDEQPGDEIFADGFESGDTSAW